MQKTTSKGLGSKAKAGRFLFWLGSVVLVVESWQLLARLAEFWRGTGAVSLGWMAAIGAVVQKALSLLVWNQALLLAVAVKVLVLCCPLVVIAVGVAMMRQSNLARVSETTGSNSIAQEERR